MVTAQTAQYEILGLKGTFLLCGLGLQKWNWKAE